MSKKSYVVGFPRIGEQRELKKVLENFWADKCSFQELNAVASQLKKRHWLYQREAGIDFISSNDFSLYDNMLDTAIMLGAIPKRFSHLRDEALYFAMARGTKEAVAMEMTKWFNTNYHYIVAELTQEDNYRLNAQKIINEYKEAKALGIKTKINLIGPITFVALSKRVDGGDSFEFFENILRVYEALLQEISQLDSEVTLQIDEPIFAKDNDSRILTLIKPSYKRLAEVASNVNIIVTSYFEHSNEATKILVHSPIWGIGLDFVHGEENFESLEILGKSDKRVIAGVVDGRNIWRNDIDASLSILEKIAQKIPKERLIVS